MSYFVYRIFTDIIKYVGMNEDGDFYEIEKSLKYELNNSYYGQKDNPDCVIIFKEDSRKLLMKIFLESYYEKKDKATLYIGKTNDINRRYSEHKIRFGNTIQIEIIKEFDTEREAFNFEQNVIKHIYYESLKPYNIYNFKNRCGCVDNGYIPDNYIKLLDDYQKLESIL